MLKINAGATSFSLLMMEHFYASPAQCNHLEYRLVKVTLSLCLDLWAVWAVCCNCDISWYVVQQGGLLHPVLLAHLVVVQDVARASLHRPGLGEGGWIFYYSELENDFYLVPHPVSDTAWLDHVRLGPAVGAGGVVGVLELTTWPTATLAITVSNISACLSSVNTSQHNPPLQGPDWPQVATPALLYHWDTAWGNQSILCLLECIHIWKK